MTLSRLRDGVAISAQKVADRPPVSSAIGRSIVLSRTYGGKLSMPTGMASGCIRSMELGTRLSGDCVASAQLVNSCRPLRPYIENTQSQIDYRDGLHIATSPFLKGIEGDFSVVNDRDSVNLSPPKIPPPCWACGPLHGATVSRAPGMPHEFPAQPSRSQREEQIAARRGNATNSSVERF